MVGSAIRMEGEKEAVGYSYYPWRAKVDPRMIPFIY